MIKTCAGMTEDMCKRMVDPGNVITTTVSENSDGSLTMTTEHSMATEFNNTNTFKVTGKKCNIQTNLFKNKPCRMGLYFISKDWRNDCSPKAMAMCRYSDSEE